MDITMCLAKECPKKEKCYRFIGKANPLWQSYSDFEEICLADNTFIHFMNTDKNSSKGDV